MKALESQNETRIDLVAFALVRTIYASPSQIGLK